MYCMYISVYSITKKERKRWGEVIYFLITLWNLVNAKYIYLKLEFFLRCVKPTLLKDGVKFLLDQVGSHNVENESQDLTHSRSISYYLRRPLFLYIIDFSPDPSEISWSLAKISFNFFVNSVMYPIGLTLSKGVRNLGLDYHFIPIYLQPQWIETARELVREGFYLACLKDNWKSGEVWS